MKSKRLYITPLLNIIVIDNAISMSMETMPNLDDDDLWGTPPPAGSENGDESNSQFDNSKINHNLFNENPFK